MHQTATLQIQELGITYALEDFNPQIVTPEFLLYSGIITDSWQLARQPICTPELSQLVFANSIVVVAQPQRVTFVEAIAPKPAQDVIVPAMARSFVETLPQINYLAVGTNPRGFVTFESADQTARRYVAQTLLSAGEWQEFGTCPMRATVNLAYTLEHCAFNLGINEAFLRQQDETTIPIAWFGGNFSYNLTGITGENKLAAIFQAIENWQADVTTYQELVNSKFLPQVVEPKVVIPDVFAMSAKA